MPYQFKNSWEIEGLEVPMWNPELIPKGYVQSFDDSARVWRVRKEKSKNYLPYFPLVHFDDFPDLIF